MSNQSLTTLEEVAEKVFGDYQYLTIDEQSDGKRTAYISRYDPTYCSYPLAGFNHFWALMQPYICSEHINVAPSLIASLDPSICYDLYNYLPKE